MTDKELKKIHGNDVELASDDSEDELLTEKEALSQASEDGITFVDKFYVIEVGKLPTAEDEYFNQIKDAQKDLKEKGDGYYIVTQREKYND